MTSESTTAPEKGLATQPKNSRPLKRASQRLCPWDVRRFIWDIQNFYLLTEKEEMHSN